MSFAIPESGDTLDIQRVYLSGGLASRINGNHIQLYRTIDHDETIQGSKVYAHGAPVDRERAEESGNVPAIHYEGAVGRQRGLFEGRDAELPRLFTPPHSAGRPGSRIPSRPGTRYWPPVSGTSATSSWICGSATSWMCRPWRSIGDRLRVQTPPSRLTITHTRQALGKSPPRRADRRVHRGGASRHARLDEQPGHGLCSDGREQEGGGTARSRRQGSRKKRNDRTLVGPSRRLACDISGPEMPLLFPVEERLQRGRRNGGLRRPTRSTRVKDRNLGLGLRSRCGSSLAKPPERCACKRAEVAKAGGH